jgi:lipoate-protein ligase A
MMPVTALVMNPRFTVALVFPFCGIGAADALVIPGTVAELRRRVLGQVMGNALPVKANLAAALKSRPEKFIGKAVQSNRSRVTNISEHLPDEFPADVTPITDIASFWSYLEQYICSRHPEIEPYTLTEADIKAIDTLCQEKYSQESWNFGSSPAYSFSKTAKLTGGIVELFMTVSKGSITDLKIMGDYFFTLPTEEFCQKLIGTPHTIEAISNVLEGIPTASYFNNISVEEPLDKK